MIYNFDHGPDRRGTDCLKYDFAPERGKPANVLPLWVADMDFPAPTPVLEKIRAMADHGIFGYTDTKPAYDAAVCGWFRRRFGWDARPEWLVKTPGVVFALAMAVRALTSPGDAVVIQPPVYYPFFEVIRDNGRRIAENPPAVPGQPLCHGLRPPGGGHRGHPCAPAASVQPPQSRGPGLDEG